MEAEGTSWWHRHGWTAVILLAAVGIAFAIRTIFAGPIVEEFGALYTYGGGSDSYYHSRVMEYIIENHVNLVVDPMLRYPLGAVNPREPLFDWMNAILGIVFAPFFGGNAINAGAWFLDLQAPLWAALCVLPTYLIGREVGGRRVGLIAAIISPFLVASINESIFGYANYLSFYTFFVLVTLYAYLRTVKAVGSHRWVASYRRPRSILRGLRHFLGYERTALKWSVFTGICFGALALAWQGYTYVVAIIAVFLVVGMIVERIRRIDSFGLYVSTFIVALVGFPMAMPYYYVQGEFYSWFGLPLLVYFGVLALLLPFLLMRDLPWVVSIPALVGIVAAGAGALAIVNPSEFTNIVTGQGYFVKTLIYSTVAEAQAPSFDQLVVSYGVIAFFLAFVGMALVAWQLARKRFQRWMLLFLVYGIVSLYLGFSASKFLLLASPAFALLPAIALKPLWDTARYPQMREKMASISEENATGWKAFRRSFKPRHVLVMALVIGLLVPNIWYAVGAGIPSNTQSQASTQVYNSLPSWLQSPDASSSNFYFGAAGSSLDTWNQYDSAGYNWLATQDANLPEPQRPALVSWWDYGFQTIDQGQHPSVADNFQNGIDPAGQFLLTQNESQAIANLASTLIISKSAELNRVDIPALNAIFVQNGLSPAKIDGFLTNLSQDYRTVVANPQIYLPVNPNTLTEENAEYMVLTYYISATLPLSGVADLYNAVQEYTGWTIRYAMVDSRLIPFSGSDTGIYYAPADLTGRVIDANGDPSTFFNVTAEETSSGEQYAINYFTPFYNSMIYRIYFGYNGTDVGQSGGIPGLEGAIENDPIQPGWMLEHFEVEYETTYYCSNATKALAGASCYVATNRPTALALQAAGKGTADTSADEYFNGGESILVYYAGQPLVGTVTTSTGAPVGGARVTVYDSFGVPHQTVVTGTDGSYSVVLPPGLDTVNVTMGTFNGLTQADGTLLKSYTINVSAAEGFGFNTPAMVQPVVLAPSSVQGFVYWNTANSSSYAPSSDQLIQGAQIVLWGATNESRYTMTTDASGSFLLSNVAPGVYNYNILFDGQNYTENALTVTPSTPTNATIGLASAFVHGQVTLADGSPAVGATVTASESTGRTVSTVSDADGNYSIGNLGPGNYTITATGPGAGERSGGVAVSIVTPGQNSTLNLTTELRSSFSFRVLANGAPAVGVAVRFTPIPTLSSSNASALKQYDAALADSTVLYAGAGGIVSGQLPDGNYSVYAVGYVGSTLYAGLGTLELPPPLNLPNPASITMRVAVAFTGSVADVAGGANTSTIVTATDLAGDTVLAAASSTGAFALYLPAATYAVSALEGGVATGSSVYAAVSTQTLTYATTVSLTPTPATLVSFEVGSPLNGTAELYPASGANVTISTAAGGPGLRAFGTSGGTVSLYLPATAASYCVAAAAFGFVARQECGLSPTELFQLATFPISLAPVPTTLTVVGVPVGVGTTVTLAAESSTAQSVVANGGPKFSFLLSPGVYGVGAKAKIGTTTVYLPSETLSTTVPVGATSTALTLRLVPQINSSGRLVLPSTLPAASVALKLTSPLVNLSVTGAEFESGFYAAPGSYTVYASGSAGGVDYANLTTVTINSTGVVKPALGLTLEASVLNGTLAGPSGATLGSATTQVTITAPSGITTTAAVTNGTFSIALAPGQSYGVSAQATVLVSGTNGSYYTSYATLPGYRCAVPTGASSSCTIPTTATVLTAWLNGTLSVPNQPYGLAGTLTVVGPYPSLNVTTYSTNANGSFSLPLQPGAYMVYATAGGPSAPYANISDVTALPSSPYATIELGSTWNVQLSVAAPTGAAPPNAATLTLRSAYGTTFVVPAVPLGTTYALSLPRGSYLAAASAQGSPYGVSATAQASAQLVVRAGNVLSQLALAYAFSASALATLVGPSTVTIPASGGTVFFTFTLTNTGTEPATYKFTGAPSYWGFKFTPSSVTLSPAGSGSSVSIGVAVTVPSNTLVSHPGIVIQALGTGGTVSATVSPTPTVNVQSRFGIAIGPTPISTPPQIAPNRTLLPFYVANTGNAQENVELGLTNAYLLHFYGWDSNITQNGGVVTGPVEISAQQNETFYLNLTAQGPNFNKLLTAGVTVSVLNVSGGLQAATTLTITSTTVTLNSTGYGVTGPGVGPAPNELPEGLVIGLAFVPAILLAAIVALWRWNRTRRWERA